MKKNTEETIITMQGYELVLLSAWLTLIGVKALRKALNSNINDYLFEKENDYG